MNSCKLKVKFIKIIYSTLRQASHAQNFCMCRIYSAIGSKDLSQRFAWNILYAAEGSEARKTRFIWRDFPMHVQHAWYMVRQVGDWIYDIYKFYLKFLWIHIYKWKSFIFSEDDITWSAVSEWSSLQSWIYDIYTFNLMNGLNLLIS